MTQAFVHRRCTLTQEQWEKYLGAEDPESLTLQYSTNSQAVAKGAAPVQYKGKTASKYDIEASGRNPRNNNRCPSNPKRLICNTFVFTENQHLGTTHMTNDSSRCASSAFLVQRFDV